MILWWSRLAALRESAADQVQLVINLKRAKAPGLELIQ
jgi:hypothetical protein